MSARPKSPADMQAFIIERLVGDRGDPSDVIGAGQTLGNEALEAFLSGLNAQLASPIGIELRSVEITRFSDVKPEDVSSYAMTIGSARHSADALVMLVDADALAVVVSALFGADPQLPVSPITRDLSPTELDVAAIIFNEAATAINGIGERGLGVLFPLPAPISGAELKRKVLRNGPAARLLFSLSIGSSTGLLAVHLPQRVLMEKTGAVAAEPEVASPAWSQRFNDEVMRSKVMLEATMPLQTMTLGALAGLKAGQIIELAPNARVQARLSARKKVLFECEFGKLDHHYTVRINNPFDEGKDLMDGLLPREN
ncbi:flagellar motor switch protein FliM [Mesorhizobium sp. NBSH29]|uniref:FliM/FliN family flagellar motor switch protein n=1 Tax=Mesorhizobium sp. NBSH29 TaxID=2654249 RepID=UPI00189693AD|nr:FliM/FliN family flagellar motor switch protein [Mesorhizobium sp. NBSH29]QPC85379.1 flagellar motor switch protein FliM [Mesorhizobium sp. NBSH29]